MTSFPDANNEVARPIKYATDPRHLIYAGKLTNCLKLFLANWEVRD